jgi:hypothetical protein
MDPTLFPREYNEAAKKYAAEGMAVLPAPPGEKEAMIEGWPSLILGVDSIDA